MLSPEYLARIAEGSEEIASQLHTYIIRQIIDRMMIRMGRGDDYILTSSDAWRISVLQDVGYLLEDITVELAKYTKKQEKEIKEAMEEAGVKALEYDDKIYQAAGLSPMPLTQSPALIQLMERNYNVTLNSWKNYIRTTAEAAQRLFIDECDFAYNKVLTGTVAYNTAVREAVESVASGGVNVNYPSGRRLTIEAATAMVVRTGISQATRDISLKRMEEMNWELLIVSAHLGARIGDGGENFTNHSWFQGKIYSRTGKDKRFPPYSVCGDGEVQGIHGPNCRHSIGSSDGESNPFEKFDSEENRKMYEKEQRQRALERRVRKTKREVMGLQEAVEKCQDEAVKFELQQTLDRKSYLLQRQNKAYNEFCKENDLRTQQERLRIARFDRQRAAAARGAARRFQNAKGT